MKGKRQEEIINLIKNKIIITQEDLQSELVALGFNVTQSTVSRDIKDLKIVKGHDKNGNYRYIAGESIAVSKHSEDHYCEVLKRSAKSAHYAVNNVVVKCHNGMASSACVAVDSMFGDMMLGSLAGDDTIIVVTGSEEQSILLYEELNKIIGVG